MSAEYLRRNLLVAKACGIRAGARELSRHALGPRRKPCWVQQGANEILARIALLIAELVQYRDEVKP